MPTICRFYGILVHMYFDVVEAQYIDDYRVKLEFEDGSTGTVDLAEYLKDFNVRYGTIIWGSPVQYCALKNQKT